jgi:hypothetical protein
VCIIYRFDFKSAALFLAYGELPVSSGCPLPSSRNVAVVGDESLSTIVDKKRISASPKTTITVAKIFMMARSTFDALLAEPAFQCNENRKVSANRLFAANA